MGHRMSGGTLFWSALVLLIAAAAGFFIVSRQEQPVAGGERVFSRLPELPQQGAAGATAQAPVPVFSSAAALPIEPAPLVRDAFTKLQQAAEQIAAQGIRLPLSILKPDSSSALPFIGAITPGAVARGGVSPRGQPFSEEEIFNRIWPREYLGYLKGLERLEIRDGVIQATDPGSMIRFGAAPRISSEFDEEDPVANWVIPPGERHPTFATDQDVYDSYLTILERARANDWITEEEFERFRHGIREVLPRLIERERENFRRGVPSSLTLPRDQRFSESTTVRTLVQNLLDGIKYVLLSAEPVSAGWTTAPDCYKDDDPSSRALGFNAASFCCNCGIVWICGKGGCVPVFVPDCGPDSSVCDVPLGCLNAVCKDKPNAIWDPGSGICGCG